GIVLQNPFCALVAGRSDWSLGELLASSRQSDELPDLWSLEVAGPHWATDAEP
ncbi:hypothetical protein A2U01_0053067, partial [Trifolium medium]|nr:hypothetical protein [Trifolium medium]